MSKVGSMLPDGMLNGSITKVRMPTAISSA